MSTRQPTLTEGASTTSAMTAGRAAMREGMWSVALSAFSTVVEGAAAEDPVAAEAWEGIGQAAYWQDDADRAIAAHERAFAMYRRLNRPAAAARMALWLADDHMSFLGAGAVANGWVEQAERLLAESPEAPERAWLPIYQCHYALQYQHDTERALSLAREAREVARARAVPEVEVVALALEGLALVLRGDVDIGMPQLDEASAAAVSRELEDLNAVAWAFCCLIQGCDTVRDFSRAAEWCQQVIAFCERWGLGPIFTSCRTRYASVLTWQGEWRVAESQIEQMLARHGDGPRPPAVARSALITLGELRRRQGRLDQAEAMFQQAGEHRAAILGRAAIALARGEPEVAMDLADRVLRMLPPTARTDRADGLLLRILAAARLGSVEQASEDLRELRQISERLGTEAVRAAAAHARGALAIAAGDTTAALAAYEDALAHYDRCGAPHEAAQIRLELAELLMAHGRETTARREAEQAREEFDRLGAAADLEQAEAFLRRHARVETGARAEPALPLTHRELEILRLVSRGRSNNEIASEIYLSPHTVKRHLANILRKLDCSSRAEAVAKMSRAGAL